MHRGLVSLLVEAQVAHDDLTVEALLITMQEDLAVEDQVQEDLAVEAQDDLAVEVR